MKNYIMLLLALVMVSCGSRKVQMQLSESETKTATSETVKENTSTSSEKETVSVLESDDLVISPIDNTRPMEIIAPDGKKTTVTNGRIEKRTSKKSEASKEKTASASEKKTDRAAVATVAVKEKAKNIQRKNTAWYWWLLLIPIAAYGYYRYKRIV